DYNVPRISHNVERPVGVETFHKTHVGVRVAQKLESIFGDEIRKRRMRLEIPRQVNDAHSQTHGKTQLHQDCVNPAGSTLVVAEEGSERKIPVQVVNQLLVF